MRSRIALHRIVGGSQAETVRRSCRAVFMAASLFSARRQRRAQLTKAAQANLVGKRTNSSANSRRRWNPGACVPWRGFRRPRCRRAMSMAIVALVRTYGVREGRQARQGDARHGFRLASLSKELRRHAGFSRWRSSRAKFLLRRSGRRPVPEFKLQTQEATDAVTVEDILSTAPACRAYAYDDLLEAGVPPLEVLSRYADVKMSCAVGACYGYQNSAFNMIATIIEKTTGKPYADELRARVIEPLGLKTVSVGLQGLMSTGNWARPHRRLHNAWQATSVKQGLLRRASRWRRQHIDPLIFATWMIAADGRPPDVIPPDITLTGPAHAAHRDRLAETPARRYHPALPVRDTRYGLGWRIYKYAGPPHALHPLGRRRGLLLPDLLAAGERGRDRDPVQQPPGARSQQDPADVADDYELGLKTD